MSKIAIISGASAGIGTAAAEQFLELGFHVVNVSRRPCPIDGVEDCCGDLSNEAGTRTIASDLVTVLHERRADAVCLVHNAALMLKDSCESCADDDLARVLRINVAAVNSLNRALIPHLPRGSSVIYVGSTLAEKAVAGTFSYVVSKHAQLGMMRATCQDLMGRGIHTSMICPGFTDTEMLRAHLGNDPEILEAISQTNSFKRLVLPSEIAEMLIWAHHNPVINGSVIHGNLGQLEH
ncbi:hypothetical protein NOR51B_172 [Luminiphilus syltensis NOR5-1B]|uniref:Short-chain dehydrogenase/reductase SDR n=1 Tax=Luminiphilus syltensis NOR5-1B TaxID=565045 RepID=B8KQC5_9GAMM|nr:SDR family oxidoreductase [Luminiphilus syltensis]EED34235.1 hypothetical protein NOR51B_172 [Luminiphilus syltensis NOR5-1B]